MKKLITVLVAAFTLTAMSFTEGETKMLDAARAFAAADSFRVNGLGIPTCGVWSGAFATNAALAAAVDDILSAGKIAPVNICAEFPQRLPKTWAMVKRTRAGLFPGLIARYEGTGPAWSRERAVKDAIEGLHRGYGYISLSKIEAARSDVLKLVGPYIRRHLRSQGKSFITKDGVNPQQQLMDEVSACLNAPKFVGLQAKLAEIGLDIPVGSFDDVTPSAAALAALQDKIYYGDVPFDDHLKGMLLFCLGTDGYNAFVKRYNAE